MGKMNELFQEIIECVEQDMSPTQIARKFGITEDMVYQIIASEFTELGNSPEQTDLEIMLSLKTPDEMIDWAESVGHDDALYGISLLLCAAHDALDAMTEDGPFDEALEELDRIMAL
jgi:hypothetical protein